MKIKNIQIDAMWNRDNEACYSDTMLAFLYDKPMTLLDVLKRDDEAEATVIDNDGDAQTVSWKTTDLNDRLWVIRHAFDSQYGAYALFSGFLREWCNKAKAMLTKEQRELVEFDHSDMKDSEYAHINRSYLRRMYEHGCKDQVVAAFAEMLEA